MAGFFNAISAVLMLFMLMSVGYAMGWLKWMGPAEKKFISRFVINIAVPLNCLTGILNNLQRDDLAQAVKMLISAYIGIIITLLVSAAAATLLKLPRKQWGVFVTMAGLSNALFIGLPLSTQLFGEVSIPFVMVYYLGNTTFTQSVAILLIERAGSDQPKGISVKGIVKDLITKPPTIGVAVSVLCLALGVYPPALFMKFAGYISSTVTPLALIYCGYIIYEVGLRNLRMMRGIPTMLVIRLLVAPLICTVMCSITGMTGLARSVFIVESALPVVTQVTVMAGAFGADEQYAATGACISMLCCFITIPVLMLWLG